jgi:hypothetical protein
MHILGMMATRPKLLTEVLPEFAVELEQLLLEKGESELARQVSTLSMIDRCRCDGDFCSMFYYYLSQGSLWPGSPQRFSGP